MNILHRHARSFNKDIWNVGLHSRQSAVGFQVSTRAGCCAAHTVSSLSRACSGVSCLRGCRSGAVHQQTPGQLPGQRGEEGQPQEVRNACQTFYVHVAPFLHC